MGNSNDLDHDLCVDDISVQEIYVEHLSVDDLSVRAVQNLRLGRNLFIAYLVLH